MALVKPLQSLGEMTKPVYWSPLSFAQSLRVTSWVRQWDIDKFINVNKTFLCICDAQFSVPNSFFLERFAACMFMKIRPMESNLQNSASDFLYHTHFYFNILSLAAKISARLLHMSSTLYMLFHRQLFSSNSHWCAFSSLAINKLHDLSLFKKMTKKRPCSKINAFKNSDPNSLYTLHLSFNPLFIDR